MVNVVEIIVNEALKIVGVSKQENFQNNGLLQNMTMADTQLAILGFIIVLVYLILVLLFGKVLWNSCLCELLPVKKCRSVWHILGLMILLGLILPTSSK